jgi:LacI family transcriptional regulator
MSTPLGTGAGSTSDPARPDTPQPASIASIAAEAGVSIPTVS